MRRYIMEKKEIIVWGQPTGVQGDLGVEIKITLERLIEQILAQIEIKTKWVIL